MMRKIDKRACRKFAMPELEFNLNEGVLHVESCPHIIRTAVHNISGQRILVLYIYQRESILAGSIKPRWVMFHSRDDFATLSFREDTKATWQCSTLGSLDRIWGFDSKCAFYRQQDESRVARFCKCERGAISMLGYRQMFFYKDGTLYQSRLYPADTGNALEVSKLFRHLVQKAISRCLAEPNLWYLKTKRSDLDAHYSTRRGSLHYPDYDFHGNLSILQGHKKDTVLPIGAAALCVCCGNELWSNGDIKCSCKDVVVCRKCGQTVARGQGIYLEDGFYCKTCLHICEACGRPTLDTMYPAYDRRGSLLQICHDCYQQLTASCTSCSMAAACRTMGFTICKKATIPVAA